MTQSYGVLLFGTPCIVSVGIWYWEWYDFPLNMASVIIITCFMIREIHNRVIMNILAVKITQTQVWLIYKMCFILKNFQIVKCKVICLIGLHECFHRTWMTFTCKHNDECKQWCQRRDLHILQSMFIIRYLDYNSIYRWDNINIRMRYK